MNPAPTCRSARSPAKLLPCKDNHDPHSRLRRLDPLIFDASRLWADAGTVIALRSWRLMAGGPAASRELERMFSEKVEVGFELAGALVGGRAKGLQAAARKTFSVYGKRVRENRRRLG